VRWKLNAITLVNNNRPVIVDVATDIEALAPTAVT